MPQWATFAGVTIVVLVCLLALTHLTQRAFSAPGDSTRERSPPASSGYDRDVGRSAEPTSGRLHESPSDRPRESSSDHLNEPATERSSSVGDPLRPEADPTAERERRRDVEVLDRQAASDAVTSEPEMPFAGYGSDDRVRRTRSNAEIEPSELSTGTLLANVALSQGLFAVVLIGAAIYAGIPADALGIEFSASYLVSGIFVGTAVGIGLYVANEIGAASATWFGFDHDEDLRALLAPDSLGGWVVLLVGVLPVIAVFEELLFRAALIGALSAGFGIDPWLLAAFSSIAFGLGHGMQGSVGIVVTTVLGFVLAGIFLFTGSLLVVIVAHYLINAFEFVVHEGLGFDWARIVES